MKYFKSKEWSSENELVQNGSRVLISSGVGNVSYYNFNIPDFSNISSNSIIRKMLYFNQQGNVEWFNGGAISASVGKNWDDVKIHILTVKYDLNNIGYSISADDVGYSRKGHYHNGKLLSGVTSGEKITNNSCNTQFDFSGSDSKYNDEFELFNYIAIIGNRNRIFGEQPEFENPNRLIFYGKKISYNKSEAIVDMSFRTLYAADPMFLNTGRLEYNGLTVAFY